MPSTIFSYLGKQPSSNSNSINNLFGNAGNFFAEFSKFRNNMKGVTNPKAEVERLLQSGEMSQEQYSNISNMLTSIGLRNK